MKATFLQEDMAKGLSVVSRIIGQKTTLPILLNVLVQAKEDRIKLVSTNMELTISVMFPAEVEREGETTIPAKILNDLISTMPNPKVMFDLDVIRQNITLYSGTSVNDIKCVDSVEFPKEPSIGDEGTSVIVPLQEFRTLVKKSSVSAYTDEQPKILSGDLLRFSENCLTIGSVDGMRASEGRMKIENSNDFSFIVPAKNILEFSKIAPDNEEIVSIHLPAGENRIIFKTKNLQFTSGLLNGNFPEYWNIFPKSSVCKIKVSSLSFLKAIKQAEVFARESSNVMRIENKKDLLLDELKISSKSKERGANNATIPSETTSSGIDSIPVSFAVDFVREIMEVVENPNVSIELNSSNEPIVIREDGNDNYIWLMMPRNPKIDDEYKG